MLKKIVLELSMNLSILNPLRHCKESLYCTCIVLWPNMILIGDKPKVLWHVSLIFNDHVSVK
jgi:hypothetical protein